MYFIGAISDIFALYLVQICIVIIKLVPELYLPMAPLGTNLVINIRPSTKKKYHAQCLICTFWYK